MKNFTKFNPEGKEKLTYGEALSPAMEITDPEDAKQYFDAYVEFQIKHMKDQKNQLLEMAAKGGNIDVNAMLRAEAEKICKSNLGYFAGYCDSETRERVERLFCCAHPVFGSIADNGAPTPEQAYEMGVKMGEKLRKKSKR